MTSEAPASTAEVTIAGNENIATRKSVSCGNTEHVTSLHDYDPIFLTEKLLVCNLSEVLKPLAIWLLYRENRVARSA
jgi:hypothetical protein